MALEERLERVKHEQLGAHKATSISRLAVSSPIQEPFKSLAQGELLDQLYDERGLPK
jgi:hypothetical protein